MDLVNSSVCWYQSKIGAYDKQLWEQSVEEAVLQNIHNLPKKKATVKPELIDVDLVRGSTFSKAKPQHGWLAVAVSGVLRVVFLPLYLNWWKKQTSAWFGNILLLSYVLQLSTLMIFYQDGGKNVNAESLSLAHLVSPVLLMLTLSVVHAGIVATRESQRQRSLRTTPPRNGPKTKNRKNKDDGNKRSRYDDRNRVSSKARQLNSNRSHKSRKNRHCENVAQNLAFSQKNSCNESSFTCYVSSSDDGPSIGPFKRFESQRSKSAEERYATKSLIRTSSNKSMKSSLDCKQNEDRSEHEIITYNILEDTCPNTCTSVSNDKDSEEVFLEPCNEDNRTSKNIAYTTLTDSEETTFKSDDDPSRPIVEYTGTLLLPDENGQIAGGINFACDDNSLLTKEETVPGSDEEDYIPDSKQPSQGEIDLIGIKKRKDISAIKPRKCVKTSHIDNLKDQNDINIDLNVKIPDPVTGVENVDVSEMNEPELLRSPEIIAPYVASHEEQDVGAIDLVGIKNRHQVSYKFGTNSLDANNINAVSFDQSQSNEGVQFDAIAKTVVDNSEVSSCESDGTYSNRQPSTPQDDFVSLKYLHPLHRPHPRQQAAQVVGSELEWDDQLNNADTSSDTSSNCSSAESDQTENDQDKDDDNSCIWTQSNLQNVNSVMNNLASNTDKVSCMIWEGEEAKKADLTVLDIGWSIIQKVDAIPETSDYLIVGVSLSLLATILPAVFRAYHSKLVWTNLVMGDFQFYIEAYQVTFGRNWRECLIVYNGIIQRFFLCLIFFFLLSVAERTFKQRLLYAKHFCFLTSSRRAKKYELPHFRLNKVRNIKTWLSLRSYLKKRGPQRSVDTIVSASFLISITVLSLMCIELLHDSGGFLDHLGNWELVVYCMGLGIYMLRFITLGSKINKKYRNFSVLITEQINLYLRMEQKPDKKEELMLANNVLKLAEALLKELESPFKVSGLSANPFLYNVTKVVILSAFSAVLTEFLGFKLKLYKIKIK